MSISDSKPEKILKVDLSEAELRYLVSCGFALLQNIPSGSLPTYSKMTKEEILRFCAKIRNIMDENNISM